MEVGDIVGKDPNVEAYYNQVNQGNQARFNVDLKPRDQRLPVEEVMAGLRLKLAQIPGVRVFVTNPQTINLGGQQGARSVYQFTLQDTDTDELYKWAPIMEEKMRQIPGLDDVSSDLQVKNPQIHLDVNRDRVSQLGLTVNQVETALYNAYGSRQVSQILRAEQSIPGRPAARARVSAGSGRALAAVRPLILGPLDSSRHRRDGDNERRSADRGPYRPAAVGHDLLQPEAGRRAWRRRGRDPGDAPHRRCHRRSSRASRAPRRRFRTRSRGSA